MRSIIAVTSERVYRKGTCGYHISQPDIDEIIANINTFCEWVIVNFENLELEIFFNHFYIANRLFLAEQIMQYEDYKETQTQ